MIWCVEDDSSIRDIEVYALTSTGFEARGFSDGDSFLEALKVEEKPELIVLDIMLPGTDGVEILRRLKNSPIYCDIPIIMATAKGTEYDKIQSLDLGADYYITKPFGVLEFVSCIKAVLRRVKKQDSFNLLKAADIELNTTERTVTANGKRVNLTFKEFELLKLFMSHPGTVFTRDRLFSEVWGEDYIGETRTVDMHIRTLRQKLGDSAKAIETVRNVGYRLEAKNNDK